MSTVCCGLTERKASGIVDYCFYRNEEKNGNEEKNSFRRTGLRVRI